MSNIKITAPEGKKIRDVKTDRLYSEVICKDSDRDRYVLADSENDPIVEQLDGVTLADRVADLENAVEEIAVKSKVSIDLKAKAETKEALK